MKTRLTPQYNYKVDAINITARLTLQHHYKLTPHYRMRSTSVQYLETQQNGGDADIGIAE